MINQKGFILKLLPGFLPLLIYIVAESVFGEKIALYVAVIFGIIEYLFVLIKHKKNDKFILLDTFLLVIMGLISIKMSNDIFFKLKPAVIESLFVILIGVSIFTPQNIMQDMMMRYVPNKELLKKQETQFKKTLFIMFIIFLLHTVLVVYSAFYMSKESWAFISGGFLYIVFGVFILFQFVYNKFSKKIKLKVVDENQNEVGYSYKIEPDKSYIRLRFLFKEKEQLALIKTDSGYTTFVDTILPFGIGEEDFINQVIKDFPKRYFNKEIEYKIGNLFCKLYIVEIKEKEYYVDNFHVEFIKKDSEDLDQLLKEELKLIKL